MKKVLSTIWQGWKRFAHAVARVNTILLLSVFYFIILSPLGALMSALGWSPLASRHKHRRRTTNWRPVDRPVNRESLRRQS